jgi:hypothetical protein
MELEMQRFGVVEPGEPFECSLGEVLGRPRHGPRDLRPHLEELVITLVGSGRPRVVWIGAEAGRRIPRLPEMLREGSCLVAEDRIVFDHLVVEKGEPGDHCRY